MNKSIIKVILVAIPLLASVPAMAQFDNAFQSTSTMAGSGSAYASDPTYGADGAASYNSVVPNRGRTTHEHYDNNNDGYCDDRACQVFIGTDSGNTEGENRIPLGAAVPALLLLAGVYAGVVAVRRRQRLS